MVDISDSRRAVFSFIRSGKGSMRGKNPPDGKFWPLPFFVYGAALTLLIFKVFSLFSAPFRYSFQPFSGALRPAGAPFSLTSRCLK